jgi:hypothetical protein
MHDPQTVRKPRHVTEKSLSLGFSISKRRASRWVNIKQEGPIKGWIDGMWEQPDEQHDPSVGRGLLLVIRCVSYLLLPGRRSRYPPSLARS